MYGGGGGVEYLTGGGVCPEGLCPGVLWGVSVLGSLSRGQILGVSVCGFSGFGVSGLIPARGPISGGLCLGSLFLRERSLSGVSVQGRGFCLAWRGGALCSGGSLYGDGLGYL